MQSKESNEPSLLAKTQESKASEWAKADPLPKGKGSKTKQSLIISSAPSSVNKNPKQDIQAQRESSSVKGSSNSCKAKKGDFTSSSEAGKSRESSIQEKLPKIKSTYIPVGFQNLGNTCYANSVLQCLVHTTSLITKMKQRSNKNDLFVCLNQIFDGVGKGEQIASKWLNQFRSQVGQKYSSTNQEDAFEFLGTFFNKIADQFTLPIDYPLIAIHDQELRSAWKIFKNSPDQHLLDNIFATVFLKEIFCRGKNRSKHQCSFRELSFEGTFAHILPTWQLQSLEEGLENYFQIRDIGLCCPECGGTLTSQKIKIWKAPEIFIIRLNKTEVGTDLYHWNRKSQINVSEEFNVQKFIDSCVDLSLSNNYVLYSFIKHFGSNHSGHYTCYCWNEEILSWVYFSDSSYRIVSESEAYGEANSNETIILFYKLLNKN